MGNKRFSTFLLVCMMLLIVPSVFAKGERPAPSGSGGSVGGPSMSGSAVNAGSSRQGSGGGQGGFAGGAGQGAGGGQGQGGFAGGGHGAGGNGQGGFGGGQGLGGGQAQGGNGQGGFGGLTLGDVDGDGKPDAVMGGGNGQGLFANLQGANGGGFAAPSGQGGWQERFGERGTGGIGLAQHDFSQGGFMSSFSQGGFGVGALSQNGTENDGTTNMEGSPWHTPNSTDNAAPAAYDDISDVVGAQEDAQQAVQDALTQTTEQAQQAADSATQQAQQAYDQFWTDYYGAVDYTAQAYYDTITASTDYMLSAYQQAVTYTAETVDYYIAYAEQYADYCYAYPWDCYSYVYDTTYNTYVYVGDSTDQASGTTEVGTVQQTAAYPIQNVPTPSAEAYEALVVFANDQLGAVVEPLYAGTATMDIETILTQLPPEMQAYFVNASAISGATYWGLLHGGAAGVLVGDCQTNPSTCTVSADNLTLQLASGSAGLYGLKSSQAMPTNPTDALKLITTVYPKLDGLSFAQISDVEQGMAFSATTASLGYDASTQQPISNAKVVYAGVVNVNGQAFVYAMVAVGEGYVKAMTPAS